MRTNLVGHLGQQLVALLLGEVAGGYQRAEQDLDVDLVVGAVDAGDIVDRVGVDHAAGQRVLDPPALGEAEVAALAHDLAAQVGAVDAQRVVGLVTDVSVGLGLGLDVGADAAVPEHVDGRPEDRADQLVRRQLGGLDPERLAHLRRQRDRLGAAREHASAGGDQGRVVVAPRGGRQLEQAPALGEAGRRVGVRVEEHVQVVEGAHQPDVLGQQHPVAEHVSGHVADADDREVLRLGVVAELAEVALDRLPGALGGDPHRLVVVAGRAA